MLSTVCLPPNMIRKAIILTLSIIGLIINSHGQDKDCLKSIKTGKFTYEGRYGQGVEIVRNEGEQVELTNKGKSRLILSVEWNTETNYVLTLKEMINSKGCLKVGDWIKVTILECEGTRNVAKYESEHSGKGESVFIKMQ